MTVQEPILAIVPVPKPAPPPEQRVSRPNRGMQRELRRRGSSNAATRISELLSKISTLKCALRASDAEIDRLKGELLAVLAENGDYKSREEQRLFQIDEDAKTRKQVMEDHRLLCFRALVDVAHQTGAYKRHPDFDTRIRRAEKFFSTELLEAILMFPAPIAPELAYLIASAEGAAQKLSSLGLIPKFFLLANMARELADQMKIELLRSTL